jgi:hypothetical protein
VPDGTRDGPDGAIIAAGLLIFVIALLRATMERTRRLLIAASLNQTDARNISSMMLREPLTD